MTFKEFMHTPNQHLDNLAREAEAQRTANEEAVFEKKENAIVFKKTYIDQLTDPMYDIVNSKGVCMPKDKKAKIIAKIDQLKSRLEQFSW